MKDTTSEKNENSIFSLPVASFMRKDDVEISVCECGKKYESYYTLSLRDKSKSDRIYKYKHEACWDCEKEQQDREMAEQIRRENIELKKRKILSTFNENSLINPKLQGVSFESYEPTNQDLSKAKQLAKRYADNFSLDNPVGLLLIGNYGTGKSHLSVAITKEIMEKDFTCIFISTPKLMTKIRSTYNKESNFSEDQIIDMLSQVDCLVLDDIGAESVKQGDNNQHTWATSKIFEIIDNRIGKHTIFTSNYPPEELEQRLGGRNFSRMMEDTHVIKMYGDDYRMRKFK